MERYIARDGIPQKTPEQGRNDTAIHLLVPIPISHFRSHGTCYLGFEGPGNQRNYSTGCASKKSNGHVVSDVFSRVALQLPGGLIP